MSTPPSSRPIPARVRIGLQPDHVRWFHVLPRTGEWVNFAPPGGRRDDYQVEWVLHWATDPDRPGDDPDVTVEIQLIDPD
ncbi:hypothetical protein WIS52_26130 [Pseudonocardia nematodicida]|uniref:Uncharacterized protein n=1 Tax=Pseudonocardia nematodicida TaxID=1206997 RepID=A0ABV1KHN4_9PSEU